METFITALIKKSALADSKQIRFQGSAKALLYRRLDHDSYVDRASKSILDAPSGTRVRMSKVMVLQNNIIPHIVRPVPFQHFFFFFNQVFNQVISIMASALASAAQLKPGIRLALAVSDFEAYTGQRRLGRHLRTRGRYWNCSLWLNVHSRWTNYVKR